MRKNNLPKDKQFKPGQSGNPKGRPKGALGAQTVIRKWLEVEENFENPVTGKMERLTQYDIIAIQQLKKARRGDTKAFEVILDRVEGKPKQALDINQDITWIEERSYGEDEEKIQENDKNPKNTKK